MTPILWILTGVAGLVAFALLYIFISTWVDEQREKRYWRKRKEAFRYVYERLSDCRYWINQKGHDPFREFFEFIMEKMKSHAHISGEEIRRKIDELVNKHNSLSK